MTDNSETLLIEYDIDGRRSVDRPVVLKFEQSNVDKAESAILAFMLTYSENTPEELLTKFRVQIHKIDSQVILFDKIFNRKGVPKNTKRTSVR